MKIKIPTSTKDLKTAAKEGVKAYGRMFDPLDMVMPSVANTVGLGDIYGKVKSPDYSGYDGEQAKAMEEQRKAIEEFVAGGAPVYERGQDLNYKELDPSKLAQLGPSAYQDIVVDPRYVDAELDALSSLEERSNEGLTLQDEADMARLKGDVNRQNRGRMGAIQQEMQSRGLSGSGLDLVSKMQANQDATEMEALASLEKAAQVQNNKRAAAVDLGNMASQQRNQQFQEDAQKAAARDEINRFNTANSVDQQRQNLAVRNAATEANWGRTNQTADKNVGSQYDFRKDKLTAQNTNAQNAYNWSVDKQNTQMQRDQQKEDASANQMGSIFGAAGGVIGGIYGGPTGAAAGYQVGSGVGQSAGRNRYQRGYAHGGMVEGPEVVEGDDPMNDIVDISVSPGEIVLPKTVAKDPQAAADFVAQENGQSSEADDVIGALLKAMTYLNKRK